MRGGAREGWGSFCLGPTLSRTLETGRFSHRQCREMCHLKGTRSFHQKPRRRRGGLRSPEDVLG